MLKIPNFYRNKDQTKVISYMDPVGGGLEVFFLYAIFLAELHGTESLPANFIAAEFFPKKIQGLDLANLALPTIFVDLQIRRFHSMPKMKNLLWSERGRPNLVLPSHSKKCVYTLGVTPSQDASGKLRFIGIPY